MFRKLSMWPCMFLISGVTGCVSEFASTATYEIIISSSMSLHFLLPFSPMYLKTTSFSPHVKRLDVNFQMATLLIKSCKITVGTEGAEEEDYLEAM